MLRTLCAEGQRGADHIPPLRAGPGPRDLPRRARADRRRPSQPEPDPLLHAVARGGGGRRPLRPRAAGPGRPRVRVRRDLRLRPTGPAGCRARAGRRAGWSRGCTSRASRRRRWRPPAAPSGADPLRRVRRSGRKRRHRAARAGRGGRAQPRLRLPDGDLPHLLAVARRRAQCGTSAPASSPRTTPRRSRSASQHRSATSSSTSDNHFQRRR